ncbi:VOC family protein [Zunongwangia sp. F260]|uniref:VOC family protein n=1 Tax=Autumnicola lenta TaxID=3075593 RepID=A0ABU3CNL1_9FLAO|nr:VOC family protein [Zunongwangia sp. F260]MDT0647946.1 VOC family protein [Zunongwangia sp. F260]
MKPLSKHLKLHLQLFRGIIFIFTALAFSSCNDRKNVSKDDNTSSEASNDQQIGHIVLQVSDLQKSQRFYEDILNMRTNEEASYNGKKRIFLSATESHHELVLKEGLQERIATSKRYLQQLAFKLNSREKLAEYYQNLERENLNPELKDNQISWSLYFYDPDSVYIELYWDVRDEDFGDQKLRGIQEELSPEQLLNGPNSGEL